MANSQINTTSLQDKLNNLVIEIPSTQTLRKELNAEAGDMSLREVILHGERGKFGFPEGYQRGRSTTWAGFGQQWVSSCFKQNFAHFDKLHLCKNDPHSDFLDVVEGQQRIRAILDFFNGVRDAQGNEVQNNLSLERGLSVEFKGHKICLGGLTWQNIRQFMNKGDKTNASTILFTEYIESVLNRKFDVSWYFTPNESEVAEVFVKINNKTALEDQEKRNPKPGPAARIIRATARVVVNPVKGISFHELFSRSDKKGSYINIPHAGMYYEQIFAEWCLFQKEYKNGTNTAFAINPKALNELYDFFCDESSKDMFMKEIYNPVKNKCDILLKMVKHDNKENRLFLNKGTLDIYYYVLSAIESHHKKTLTVASPLDGEKLHAAMWKLHSAWLKKVNIPGYAEAQESPYSLKVRKSARNHKELSIILGDEFWGPFIKQSEKAFSEIGLVLRDPKRVCSDEEKLDIYVKQGRKDAVSGRKMAFGDLVKGHIVPHSKGGESTLANTVLLTKEDNSSMGATAFFETP